MTTERKRPSREDGRLGFYCLGSGKPNEDYSQSCRACGIPTQSDHLCPVCRGWFDHYASMRSAIAAIRALDTVAPTRTPRPLRLVKGGKNHEQ
jgi:hypothetical protein